LTTNALSSIRPSAALSTTTPTASRRPSSLCGTPSALTTGPAGGTICWKIYGADGQLVELYADITSPVEVRENEIAFIDHELDVSQLAGQAPRIVDQDEFAAAAVAFGYSDEFMHQCYELAEALLDVVAHWQPRGAALVKAPDNLV
jgi:hypothetical protein